jgi:hypothetical protein
MCAPAAATDVREEDDFSRFVGSSSSSDLGDLLRAFIGKILDSDPTNNSGFAASHEGPEDTLDDIPVLEASKNNHCSDEDLGPDMQVRS